MGITAFFSTNVHVETHFASQTIVCFLVGLFLEGASLEGKEVQSVSVEMRFCLVVCVMLKTKDCPDGLLQYPRGGLCLLDVPDVADRLVAR